MARSRWRDRLLLMGMVAAGCAAGIAVGSLLVHLIIGNWGKV